MEGKGEGRERGRERGREGEGKGAMGGRPPPFRKFLDPPLLSDHSVRQFQSSFHQIIKTNCPQR